MLEMYRMRRPADREAFFQRYLFDDFEGPSRQEDGVAKSMDAFWALETKPTLKAGSYSSDSPNLSYVLHGKYVQTLELEIEIVP